MSHTMVNPGVLGVTSKVELGSDPLGHGFVDTGVLLGYLPGYALEDERLVVGPNYLVRSGTVVYAGSRIGSRCCATGTRSGRGRWRR